MNHTRAQSILSGQTRLAQRVFAAVPKQEYWSVGQISNEMARVEKHNMTKAEVSGCLRTLVEAGLVRENGVLTFRSNVKPPVIKDTPAMTDTPAKAATKPAQPTLGERLMDKAVKLRSMADDLDALAIEVEEAIVKAGAKNAKLDKLRLALRELENED